MGTMSSQIQQLPLHSKHLQLGAKIGQFGDWEVPLYYTTILDEHEAVRTKAGLFDVSHMGKFYFEGSGVVSYLDQLLPRNIAGMKLGQALYMPLTNNDGGFVDDIIVYRIEDNRFFMIVNAGNAEKDEKWFKGFLSSPHAVSGDPGTVDSRFRRNDSGVTFKNLTAEQGLLALQGPQAAAILQKLLPDQPVQNLANYHFTAWKEGMIARTGYTGEDGYEIMISKGELPQLWDKILAQGAIPAGFGARDTLRLEAGMPLYGHDMNDEITPLELGIQWAVDASKNQYPGAQKISEQRSRGVQKKLVGFEMIDRGIPRQDYGILKSGNAVGKVTSGTFSPTLKKNIGMGYVPVELSSPGTEIEIQIRDKALKAQIVKLPFYKRKK